MTPFPWHASLKSSSLEAHEPFGLSPGGGDGGGGGEGGGDGGDGGGGLGGYVIAGVDNRMREILPPKTAYSDDTDTPILWSRGFGAVPCFHHRDPMRL